MKDRPLSAGFLVIEVIMACPKCKCEVTYTINGIDDFDDDYEMERCSACRTVFYTMDAEEDVPDDYDDLDYA